jgi:histidine kinase/DNA gyrase B/HSP90-like ATPase
MINFQIKTADTEYLPPDEKKSGDIFSRLGYKFSDAIADLIDNSVDENASKVHIRFIRGTDGIHNVVIADNGNGMSDDELREAMRFGSRSLKSNQQLGKYGIGLKSASLSQAETVTVLTRQGKSTIGRRWTLENVKRNWTCDILQESDVSNAFTETFAGIEGFRRYKSGTLIIWERLEHLRALPDNIDEVLKKTTDELMIELGIRFHRFIEKGCLEISIDQQFGFEEPTGIGLYVQPLNPFSYERSGHPDYPLTFKLSLDGVILDVECHIWPAKAKTPGYRLGGGKVALRQGFYFYRNDRIIQAGGWNGIRADDGEPHLSLARVRLNLPAALDSTFKLYVTKSSLDPSPKFVHALKSASSNGITFADYIEQAYTIYRKQKKIDGARFPLVPGTGLSVKAQKAIATILAEKGTGRPKKVSFKWTQLDHDEIFRLDAKQDEIHLNTRYKKYLVEGSTREAPVLKLVLMFLFKDELEKSFATRKSLDWVQRVNQALLASLKE